jgi:hypothetical protein
LQITVVPNRVSTLEQNVTTLMNAKAFPTIEMQSNSNDGEDVVVECGEKSLVSKCVNNQRVHFALFVELGVWGFFLFLSFVGGCG